MLGRVPPALRERARPASRGGPGVARSCASGPGYVRLFRARRKSQQRDRAEAISTQQNLAPSCKEGRLIISIAIRRRGVNVRRRLPVHAESAAKAAERV